MFAKTAEILNLMREGKVLEALPENQGEIKHDSAELRFLGVLAETTLYQGALGLLTETTVDRNDKNPSIKTKNLAPDFKFLMEVLKTTMPEKYNRADGDNTVNVNLWAAALMEIEDSENPLV